MMRTLAELETIQQELIDAVKTMVVENVLRIVTNTGVTLTTMVRHHTASFYLGKEANDNILGFCLVHLN